VRRLGRAAGTSVALKVDRTNQEHQMTNFNSIELADLSRVTGGFGVDVNRVVQQGQVGAVNGGNVGRQVGGVVGQGVGGGVSNGSVVGQQVGQQVGSSVGQHVGSFVGGVFGAGREALRQVTGR
jgi:hypothetical protein